MQVTFSKNYKLAYVPAPNKDYPEGSPHTQTFKIEAQDGSTFTEDAILIGRLEKREGMPWSPVRTNYLHRYTSEQVDQPRHQLATWFDGNKDGLIDDSEIRDFDNRVGDVNPNQAGGFAAITTDLSVSEGESGRWYVREDIGVLKTL